MKTFVISLIFLIGLTPCYSQTGGETGKKIPINLPTILKLAGANNLTIKQYNLLYHLSISAVAQAYEWYLPTVFVGPEAHFLQGANMNAMGLKVNDANQRELWFGGGLATEWDFSNGIYNVMAKKQQSIAAKENTQAQRNNVILQAISDYYDLLTAQFQYMQLTNLLAQADTISTQIKVQVDAGLRYESEYLLAQSSYSHISIERTSAQVNYLEKSNALLSLLNIDTSAVMVSMDTGMEPLDLMKNITDTSLTNYTQYIANRPEYKSMQAELSSIQDQKKTVTVGLLMPKLYLGSAPDGVMGDFGSPYNSTYRVDGALLWSIPIGLLAYKGELKEYNDQINIEQNGLDQFSNQVYLQVGNARAQLILARDQIQTATLALTESKNALSQSIEREALGTVRPFEVFQSEEFYVQAEIDYLNSVSNFNKAQYNLYVAIGNNL